MYRHSPLAFFVIAGVVTSQNAVSAQSSTGNVSLAACRTALNAYITTTQQFNESVQPTGDTSFPTPSVTFGAFSAQNLQEITSCVQSYENSVLTSSSLCSDALTYVGEVAAAGQAMPVQESPNQLTMLSIGATPRIQNSCSANRPQTMPVPSALTDNASPSSEAATVDDDGSTESSVSETEDRSTPTEVTRTDSTSTSSSIDEIESGAASADIGEQEGVSNPTSSTFTEVESIETNVAEPMNNNPRALW